ncbi:SIS domain-containing protein [Sphingomonas sp. CLY1604]|uniref:SIS domain-containing protein n=1 Tax=Sphingomonas sp. CLY1604 TaxID=3457786 RepID=UPI003FD7DF46
MRAETLEAGDTVARLLERNAAAFAALGGRLRGEAPDVVVTCARGSSDHAAMYGKYLIETMIGTPVASAAPSVVSLFDAPVATRRALCIAISQSGRSPDLLATVEAHAKAGAQVVALVNDEGSPLAGMADTLLALSAGPERSVAATKSCIAAMAGLAALVAAWSGDEALQAAVGQLPEQLRQAVALDWSAGVEPLADARQMFVIGRGYGFGVAQECALKLKETCQMQAEPFSAAEVRHGPMAIVGDGFPVLALATSDAAGDDVMAVAETFAGRGATVLAAHAGDAQATLPALQAHPAVQPILMLASFYGLAEALSRRRGLDPDQPPHLAKVTRTL